MVKGKKTKKTEFSIRQERIETIGRSGIEGIELRIEVKCNKNDFKHFQKAVIEAMGVCQDWDYVGKVSLSLEFPDYKLYRNLPLK